MKKLIATVGEKHNLLTVIALTGTTQKGFSTVRCRCECGRETDVKYSELRSGHTRSCGCQSWKGRADERDGMCVGKKFGRLTITALAGKDKERYRLCTAICDCGKEGEFRICQLVRGDVQSCGCLLNERRMENIAKASVAGFKHGLSHTLTYNSWYSMMNRCYSPNHDNYHRYGGAGIKVCEGLRNNALNLVIAIGMRPSAGHSLGRIDGKLNYSCGACAECLEKQWGKNIRWETIEQQSFNKSSNHMFEVDGVVMPANRWIRLLKLHGGDLHAWLSKSKNENN